MKLFGKKNDTGYSYEDDSSSGALKVLEGAAKLLSLGKKNSEPDDGIPRPYDETKSDRQVFTEFIVDYLKELKRGD